MKIVCTQENLKAGLQNTTRIITSSNTLPILNNVLLKTESGVLKISSTNLEISIHTTVRCKVEENGEVCVPAKTFTELVSSLPNTNITLSSGDGVLAVKTETHSAVVKTLPSDDFPSIPVVDGAGVSFKAQELKDSLAHVLFAAQVSETQAEISGVFLQGTGNGCKFVATDRYRLAEKKVALPGSGFTKGLIVPLRTCQEILKALGNAPGEVSLTAGENQALFRVGDTQIISRLVDGQYPDYEQIIPTEFATTGVVSRHELLQALRTSSIFSYGSNSVRFELQADSGAVIVSSGSQDLGESVVRVQGKVTGPTVAVLFNYRYVLDMLNALDNEEIVIKVNNDNLPVVFAEQGNPNYLYLVMPIKN